MVTVSCDRISAVRSVDWSLTTIISSTSDWAATDSMVRTMEASSLRAGIMAETIGLSMNRRMLEVTGGKRLASLRG